MNEEKTQTEEQKPPESNCLDCVHRCKERLFNFTSLLHGVRPALNEYFDGGPLRPECAFLGNGPEQTTADCTQYQQADSMFILNTAAIANWRQVDVLAEGELRFVLDAEATEDDEEVCHALMRVLEACRAADGSKSVASNAYVARKVDAIPPGPIARFPATASYIGEHVLRYVLRDGGKVLLQRHERGSGTLYVCVDSAAPGMLILLRDTFSGMMSTLMEANRVAVHEFCPQDPDYDFLDTWKPQIAVCILSRTAAPVIYGALHGLPFPREESVLPDGTRIDTTNRKIFTRELAESFPDPIAREIALASLAHQLATKKGSE